MSADDFFWSAAEFRALLQRNIKASGRNAVPMTEKTAAEGWMCIEDAISTSRRAVEEAEAALANALAALARYETEMADGGAP